MQENISKLKFCNTWSNKPSLKFGYIVLKFPSAFRVFQSRRETQAAKKASPATVHHSNWKWLWRQAQETHRGRRSVLSFTALPLYWWQGEGYGSIFDWHTKELFSKSLNKRFVKATRVKLAGRDKAAAKFKRMQRLQDYKCHKHKNASFRPTWSFCHCFRMQAILAKKH